MQDILITGANRGIGLEFVRQYLTVGERVYATARDPRSADELNALAADTDRLTVLQLDTRDSDSIAACADALREYTESVDMLINNAGTNPNTPAHRRFGQLEAEALLDVLHVNAVGAVLVAQAFVGFLEAGNERRLVNISSQVGSMEWKKSGGSYAYAASKAALNMYTRVLSADLREREIAVISVHPGWVQTDMGGASASLTVEESVTSMVRFFDTVTMEHSGGFFRWDGSVHPW
jgi:NAD(P)-dependent dehydrogenase (short-subunit alcohol dehydrogenase family)